MSSLPEPRRDPLALVVLISGRGSNLQAIIDAITRGELRAVIRAVISNRGQAQGLASATQAGIPTAAIDPASCGSRDDFNRKLLRLVESYRPELVVLAGFMHVLDSEFVRIYDGRLMNIHPSLLPDFPGLNTHRRALEAGAPEHGASVHFVTDELDGGPVILRERIPVLQNEDATSLAARVLKVEHRIYPLAIRWFAEGRLRKVGANILFDGHPIEAPFDLTDN